MSTKSLLRDWRVSRNLSQQEVASTARCRQSFISMCERGKKSLSRDHITRLINTYGCTAAEIGYELVVTTVAKPLADD